MNKVDKLTKKFCGCCVLTMAVGMSLFAVALFI